MTWKVPIKNRHGEDHHVSHYLVLLLILGLYMFFMYYFKHDSIMQIVTAGVGSIFYMLWGIFHHHVEGRLTNLVALEYILVSSFVFLMMLVVLYL